MADNDEYTRDLREVGLAVRRLRKSTDEAIDTLGQLPNEGENAKARICLGVIRELARTMAYLDVFDLLDNDEGGQT